MLSDNHQDYPFLDKPIKITDQKWDDNTLPLVSISCISFNHHNYIRDAIEGFLMQETTFRVEILIHDDASTDGTSEIIKVYEQKYPNLIKPIIQKENQYSQGVRGMSKTFNYPRAKGKYFSLCEGDDFWTHRHKLQLQVDFLEKNPDYSMCYTNYDICDENGIIVQNAVVPEEKRRHLDHYEVLEFTTPKTLTSMVRGELALKNPLSHIKVPNGDTLNTAFYSSVGDVGFINEVTGVYREHSGGIWSLLGMAKQRENQLKTFTIMLDLFQEPKQQIAIRNRIKRIKAKLLRAYIKDNRLWDAQSLNLKYFFSDFIDASKVQLLLFAALFRPKKSDARLESEH